jgi:type I restriction enzyme M protein
MHIYFGRILSLVENWAMPKTTEGKLNYHKAMTISDLMQFVDLKLFSLISNFQTESDE